MFTDILKINYISDKNRIQGCYDDNFSRGLLCAFYDYLNTTKSKNYCLLCQCISLLVHYGNNTLLFLLCQGIKSKISL